MDNDKHDVIKRRFHMKTINNRINFLLNESINLNGRLMNRPTT